MVRHIDKEGIRLAPAGKPFGIRKIFLYRVAYRNKHLVSEAAAVHLVHHVEMLDIEYRRIGLHFSVIPIHHAGVLIEEGPAVKTREIVPLSRLDEAPVLVKAYSPRYPCPDYLRILIRLLYEIARSELKALHLSVLLCRKDYDGYLLQGFVCLYYL